MTDSAAADVQPEAHAGYQEAWQNALEAASLLYRASGPLRALRDQTLALLTDTLRVPSQRRQALLLLSYLDTDYTVALADTLADLAQSHRDALLVRQIFGRLPRDQAAAVVPPAVWRLLGDGADDEAYRRTAELLYHLGLTDALRRLSARALASDDPNTREVGAEFAPDDAANPG